MDKVTRLKIHNDPYFKEKCFALTAETIVDRALELKYIGGKYGGTGKPSKFLCLLLKMLQIQPEEEIVLEYVKNKDYKYIRALGCFYYRLTAPQAKDVYKVLEPLYSDYRQLNYRTESGGFEVVHMDEMVDHLLKDEIYCDVSLPRIAKRWVLEEEGLLEPYVSALTFGEEGEEDKGQQSEEMGQQSEENEEKEDDDRDKKGSAMADDWNKNKVTMDVVERRDGRDPIHRKQYKSNSQSSSSSYSSYSSYSSSSERSRSRSRDKKRD